jgi:hypothetical protein
MQKQDLQKENVDITTIRLQNCKYMYSTPPPKKTECNKCDYINIKDYMYHFFPFFAEILHS